MNRHSWKTAAPRGTWKLALATAGVVALGTAGFAFANTVVITLTPTGPQPQFVTVGWGDTVVFSNADTEPYTVASARGGFTSPEIPPGGTYTQTFQFRRGTYSYSQQTAGFGRNGQIYLNVTGQLTLATSRAAVPFGQAIVLKGKSSIPGAPVTIFGRPAGSGSVTAEVAKAVAGPDGTYSATVTPKTGAKYIAYTAGDQIRSGEVFVIVQPRLTATASRTKVKVGTTVTVTARIEPAIAASDVTLARYNRAGKEWDRVEETAFRKNGTAVFKWRAEPGRTRLRVALAPKDVESGFEPLKSRWVEITGVL